MAEKNNATCAICGKGYHMCLSCADDVALRPWKKHTDTAEHYKVYQILHGYSTGVYTKADAKSKFKSVDLSDIDSMRENIKAAIDGIIGVGEKPVVDAVAESTPAAALETPKNRRIKTPDVSGRVQSVK